MSKPAVFSDKGNWGKINSFFGLAVMAEYRLGGFPLAILFYIVGEYNKIIFSAPLDDYRVPLTFGDLANKGNTNISTIQQAIGVLLEFELIIKVNIPKGRAKTLYLPNAKLLNELTEEHLKHNPNDRVTPPYIPV